MGDPVEDEAVVGMVETRDGWTVERRIETYLLARRVGAMAAMPLWHKRVWALRAATNARLSTGRTSSCISGSTPRNRVLGKIFLLSERTDDMDIDASDGRIYLPKDLRERFGDQFKLVERGDRLVLIPVSEDPLASLREEFADVKRSARELREDGRETALDEAGS